MEVKMQDTDVKSALILVDVQYDFLPGGALAVPQGDEIITPLKDLVEDFTKQGLPVVATRDWHPTKHCSFRDYGGPWPPHCIQDTHGAEFCKDLPIEEKATIFSKGTNAEYDEYSGFSGRDANGQLLIEFLKTQGINRVFICGLATDVCVLNTVRDAIKMGLETFVVTNGIKGIDPKGVEQAVREMDLKGATMISSQQVQ